MSATASAMLSDVEDAITTILQGIADGSRVVTYTIMGRTVTRDGAEALNALRALRKELLQETAASSTGGKWRVGTMSRPRRSDP